MTAQIEPFQLAVPESSLTDLKARLARVRWPDETTVTDTSQGPLLAKMQALIRYWQDGYDWRRCERMLNAFGQFRTTIDGLGIHFLHVRSPEPDALPLLITHGWPGSVLEFREVIGRLTDPAAHGGDPRQAFHLVIPSLPGFGFSDKPTETGWTVERIADAWITLMDRLGYDRWGAQGGDWGSAVTAAIGRQAPPGCIGLHFNFAPFQPTPQERAEATPAEQNIIDDGQYYDQVLSAYFKEMATRPQTIGYALADSPVGLAAWIYTLFQDVSDSGGNAESVFSLDEMLDDIMMYWIPNTGASSARLYWETMRAWTSGPSEDRQITVPAGFSIFPREIGRASQRWVERRFKTVVHFHELEKGGHFAALEQPEVFAAEVIRSFSSLR
jgi:pimeloyl-ACP methyl ester carboxylesterase